MNVNYLTIKVLISLKYNGNKSKLSDAKDINDLKRKWVRLYFKEGEKLPDGFIKGAKMIDFQAIWDYIKS